MFEQFSRDHHRAPQRSRVPLLISTAAHIIVAGVILAIPILYVSAAPPAPYVLAFVASAPPPPPPPPPAAAPASTPAKKQVTKAAPVRSHRAAPVEAPRAIVAERPAEAASSPGLPGGIEGVPGGVVGGVPGGVVGGVVGGVLSDLPAPPPPPAPVTRAPVRVGGDVKAPALIERVQPEYPELARRAKVEGVVILEAVVDRQGRVEDVRVLRSIPLLDRAAVDAVRHWRYSPLLVSGRPASFIVTVTINFSISSEAVNDE